MDTSSAILNNPFLMSQIAQNNPALLAQIKSNQRQQALAASLMQQGATPLPTAQMAGNMVVPISPWEALAHAGQQVVGAMAAKNADDKEGQILADALGKSSTPAAPANAPPPMIDNAAAAAGAAPTDDGDSIAWNAPPAAPMSAPTAAPPAMGTGAMNPTLLHKMADSLGVTDADLTQGMIFNPTETMKAGFTALHDNPNLVGQRKGAEKYAETGQTIFPDVTVDGREHVPMTGAQIFSQTGQAAPNNAMPGGPQISNTPTGPAPQNAPGQPTQAGQSLPPMPPYDPVINQLAGMKTLQNATAGSPGGGAPVAAPTTPNNTGNPPGMSSTQGFGKPVGQADLLKDREDANKNYIMAQSIAPSLFETLKGAQSVNSQVPSGIMADIAPAVASNTPFMHNEANAKATFDQLTSDMGLQGFRQLEGLGKLERPMVDAALKTYTVESAQNPEQARGNLINNLANIVHNNMTATKNIKTHFDNQFAGTNTPIDQMVGATQQNPDISAPGKVTQWNFVNGKLVPAQ